MAVREGMIWLINHLRAMVDDERETYLTDEQLERVLDNHSREILDAQMQAIPTYVGGTARFADFKADGWLEGPPNLAITDGARSPLSLPAGLEYGQQYTGQSVGTAAYVDLMSGRFRFETEPQRPVYLTGKSYDLYGAAAEALRIQAAQVAQHFDVATDGVTYNRSQKHEQLLAQAAAYERLSPWAARSSVQVRADAN